MGKIRNGSRCKYAYLSSAADSKFPWYLSFDILASPFLWDLQCCASEGAVTFCLRGTLVVDNLQSPIEHYP